MRKIVMGCALGAVLALPATAPAAQQERGDVREAVQACKAELREIGREAFAELYESKRACVRAKLREAAAERRAGRREAMRACREQGLEGRDLRDCVRRALRERREQAQEERRRHHEECDGEHAPDGGQAPDGEDAPAGDEPPTPSGEPSHEED
jgi:hypothetical protein